MAVLSYRRSLNIIDGWKRRTGSDVWASMKNVRNGVYGFNAVDCIRVFFEADFDHMGIDPLSRRQKMEHLEFT